MTANEIKNVDHEDARLHAAQKRLRESVDQADTLEAVREIVTNLLGCEEIAIFHVSHGNGSLFWSFGIDPKKHKSLDSLKHPATREILGGEPHIGPASYGAHAGSTKLPLSVLVPIRRDGCTVAVLAMLRFLPQKREFDGRDLELATLVCDEIGRTFFEASRKANA
jgi:hypothetical protein